MDAMNNIIYRDLEILHNEIINGHNKDHFLTFATETASGKTTTARKAIVGAIKKDSKTKILLVTKFQQEALINVEKINELANSNIAIAYIPSSEMKDNKNCKKNIKDLKKYNVLAITHSMYIKLCKEVISKKNYILREYIKRFKTLIIDEEINIVKSTLTTFDRFTYEKYNKLFKKIDGELVKKFDDISLPLLNVIEYKYAGLNQLHRAIELEQTTDFIDTSADVFQLYLKYLNKEILEDYNISNGTNETITSLKELIENIKLIWKCIYDNVAIVDPFLKTIYGYDYNLKFLMLKNNIYLDASSSFNKIYELSELFEIVPTERLIDHSKCTLNVYKTNTTTSTKDKDISRIRMELTEYIKDNYEDKKVLVLTNNIECKQLREKEIYFKNLRNVSCLNFENMRGKNEYSDFEVVFYAHTYRLHKAYYILLYENATGETLNDSLMTTGIKNGHWGFKDENLRKVMETDMASSMYQGLKRVQRNTNPEAVFEIWCKDPFMAVAIKQLKGLGKVTNLRTDRDEKETKADKLLKWLNDEWDKTRVVSKKVRELLEISEKQWQRIWKDKEFMKQAKELRVKQTKVGNVQKIIKY